MQKQIVIDANLKVSDKGILVIQEAFITLKRNHLHVYQDLILKKSKKIGKSIYFICIICLFTYKNKDVPLNKI